MFECGLENLLLSLVNHNQSVRIIHIYIFRKNKVLSGACIQVWLCIINNVGSCSMSKTSFDYLERACVPKFLYKYYSIYKGISTILSIRAVPELNTRGRRMAHIFQPHHPPIKKGMDIITCIEKNATSHKMKYSLPPPFGTGKGSYK